MSRNRISILALLLSLSLAISACGAKPGGTPAAWPTGTVLQLAGPNGGHVLTMDDLRTFPLTSGWGGIKDSAGVITPPALYQGVALKDLVARLNVPFDGTMGVTLTGSDGYSMTFSYDQVMNGDFTAYDPTLGTELTSHAPLTAILAYEKDGQPLDPTSEGPLRLVVVSPKDNEVVDGHWTVKWVTKLEVLPVSASWTLHLQGAISEPVDRATFQSCSSPSCHGTSWTDANGQTWVGVPLWLLVGEVDDSNSHGANAFNVALANAGYTVDVVGSNGQSVTLDSATIKRNNNIMLACTVNNAELPPTFFPLRLVGSGLQPGQMIGQVNMIQLTLPSSTPTATATAAATEASTTSAATTGLLLSGLVNQPLTLRDAALHAMKQTTMITIPPKQTTAVSYTGVPLNDLLDQAGVKAGATTVTFIGSDGYTNDVSLSDLQACSDCLLAFTATPGSYSAVMPGMEGPNWVTNVIHLVVK
jgi:DMSO/TMAO reductase YedYZ molybdopterin-dependent catalytic subunit